MKSTEGFGPGGEAVTVLAVGGNFQGSPDSK